MHIIYLAPLFASVITSTTPNGTDQSFWIPEPTGRGTFGLLKTCIITLVLCAWAAVHPNLIRNATPLKSFGVKVTWMCYALLSPELTVSYSLVQMVEAMSLRKQWCEHFKVKPGSKEDLMGMRGAFFVIMGGVTLGPRDCLGRYPETLTAETFMNLTAQDAIPRDFLNGRMIEDKSKADALAKLVVCVQASWMLIQCVIRAVIGLPITLLELHVVIQVVCTIMMYGFWWYKPLNINEPIPVTDFRKSKELCIFYDENEPFVIGVMKPRPGRGALDHPRPVPVDPDMDTEIGLGIFITSGIDLKSSMSITSTVVTEGFYKPSRKPTPNFKYPSTLSDLEFFLRLGQNDSEGALPIQKIEQDYLTAVVNFTFIGGSDPRPPQYRKLSNTPLPDNLTIPPGASLVAKDTFFVSLLGDKTASLNKSSLPRIRQRVEKLRHKIPQKDDMSIPEMILDFWAWLRLRTITQLSHLSHEQRFRGLLRNIRIHPFQAYSPKLFLASFMVFFLYGFSHCTVWSSYFATGAEMWVWRVSSMMIPTALCIYFMYRWVDYHGMVRLDLYNSLHLLAVVIPLVLGWFSGIFLVVESFISLRRVPDGIYETISLEKYWPHF